jgi:hypothetical protein
MDLTTSFKSLSIDIDDVQRRLPQHDFEPPNNPNSDSMAMVLVVAVNFWMFLEQFNSIP